MNVKTFNVFLRHNDWADGELLRAAASTTDAQLDQSFDMGRGSLRKTMLHIHAGEHVWLRRWMGQTETPWPNEEEKVSIAALADRFTAARSERASFLKGLGDGDLDRPIAYRDSFGGLFEATLGDMIVQMILHSTHHRAQAVNMLRRLGTKPPELDYMMWVRKPK